MSVTAQLARFAVAPPAGFMTPALTESVLHKFLDTIGIMVAGADSPAARTLTAAVREAGGNPEASIIGTPYRTSLVQAGLVNGASAHALEYDDLTPDITHMSSSMVPGCLAIAEKLDLSGRELIEAFALGFEVAGRISLGMTSLAMLDRGFHTPGMMGGMGVAVAAARMMGLDAQGVRMAIGLMASSGTGIRKNVGSAGKAFHVGNGVRAGLQAATLAAHGFEVDPDAVEGLPDGHGHERFGLLESYAGPGNYDLKRIVKDLGGEFALTRIPTMVRMHPCSTVNCVLIDGTIELAQQHDLTADNVKSIDIQCHPRLVSIAPYAEPSDSYRAKFCPPYVTAAAIIDRAVGLKQFTDARVRDPVILSLMRRVRVQASAPVRAGQSWCNGDDNWCAVNITIQCTDGRTVSGRYSQAKGWPATPATWDDLRRKYEECTQDTLPHASVRESMAMIEDLPALRSVRALVEKLRATN